MLTASDEITNTRLLVITPYPLPDWALPPENEFDLRLFDPECEICNSAEAMLTSGPEPVTRELIDRLPNLKYICCLGSGYEGVDAPYAASKGITVSNSAIVTAEDVADQMLAVVLALCCQVPELDRAVRRGEWPKPIRLSIRYRKAGIVGLGAIGEAVARRIAPFGCEIRWTGRRYRETPYDYCADLQKLAEWADILLVTARADSSNRQLIDRAIIERLGPEGILANISRGSIIDEDELIAALKSGRLGGAALDVFQDEPTPAGRWEDVPNTVLSPHVGGFTTGVRRGIRELVLANLRAFFADRKLAGIVSEPV